MRTVCLSCFDESKEKDRSAIEKVKHWIQKTSSDGHARHFIEITTNQDLLKALSDQTRVKDVDVLILAAHGYSDGNFAMADGTEAAASDVVDALKKGPLPSEAVLFIFACNGAKSPALHSLFTENGRGPRMIIGATRLALSNPMKEAIKLVVEESAKGQLSLERAKTIAKTTLACQIDSHQKVVPPEKPFLCVLWGPQPNERYAPSD